jgi:SAM-dependent methyltransferase
MTTPDPDEQARRLAAESLAEDNPTGWFERLYVAASEGTAIVPWDRGGPNQLLVEWVATRNLDGRGRRALVVGCGLGDDAEFVAGLGFDTVAFDISATAIGTARSRYPDSVVDYRTADLLDPPPDWDGAFDLVVESLTVQSLPEPAHPEAIARVSRFVRPGGTLLVIAFAGLDSEAFEGPPWPLSRDEIEAFASDRLTVVGIDDIETANPPVAHRWRAEFRR